MIRQTNVNATVEEMLHLLHSSISKKVELSFDFNRFIPNVLADAAQLRQVIMNLITNASEAIGDAAGTITITTGVVAAPPDNMVVDALRRDVDDRRCVFIEVRDTGCGIDADTLEKIFDPFFTTKFTGRGLGLAAVQGIVRSHHGALQVESTPGEGTCFRVLLPPAEQGDKLVAEPARPAAAETWSGSGTVLVVDDEPGILATSRKLLERLGFDVLTARDGVECLEVYREHRDEICLVLLDITMPRMNGHEALREIKDLDPDAKVMLSSGYAEEESHADGEAGASGFIQKPYQFKVLASALRAILD